MLVFVWVRVCLCVCSCVVVFACLRLRVRGCVSVIALGVCGVVFVCGVCVGGVFVCVVRVCV